MTLAAPARRRVVRPDLVDVLIADLPVAREVRSRRGFVKEQLARAADALFHPATKDYGFSARDRSLIGLHLSLLHGDEAAVRWFGDALAAFGATDEQLDAVEDLARTTAAVGPYGHYPAGTPLAAESAPGPEPLAADAERLGARLAAGLAHAHLLLFHPRDARAAHLERLAEHGWTDTQIVILTQVVAVLGFQLRVASGLRAIAGETPAAVVSGAPGAEAAPEEVRPLDPRRPTAFTSEVVVWDPWIGVGDADENPGFDWRAVFGARRASSPSFRLSARDPLISLPLSRIEDDVFSGAEQGLDRGVRELGALAVSRRNGCLYCVSVHARTTAKFTGEAELTDRFLATGADGDYGDRWNAFIEAADALTRTPSGFGAGQVGRLRAHGLDDASILDLVHSVGYFNFANRIMLGLGDPVLR